MSKVRVLLDVDGVLNAIGLKYEQAESDFSDWQRASCQGYVITYSQAMGEGLRALQELDGVEFYWLTTWRHDANTWIRPLFDWPEFPVLEGPPRGFSGITPSESGWWKLDEARKLWDNNPVPFVWIDDDLGFLDSGATDWLQSLKGQGLGIRPDTRHGLTSKLLGEVADFVLKQLEGDDNG